MPDATVAGGWLLISDRSGFSGIPNRIARVRLGKSDFMEDPVEIEDPLSLVPFTDGTPRVLVASGFGDALYVLDAETGTLEHATADSVQLPGVMASVRRGPLSGLVLVPEVEGLRTVTLGDTVIDGGVWSFGYGVEFLPGALGIAP